MRFSYSEKILLAGSSLALSVCAAGCSATAPETPAVAVASPAAATAAPPAGNAQRAYIDPKTGEFTTPPADSASATASAASGAAKTAPSEVKTWTSSTGARLMSPPAPNALCAETPTADAAASQVTVSECQSRAATAEKAP